jgi:cytidyltransferase-like protein
MPGLVERSSIVSGYFNPLHVGHLRMMEAARRLTGRLIVIVNNDPQQMLKKGRIVIPLDDRLEIVRALRVTDEAIASIDEDATVKGTLRAIRKKYPEAELIFANGGDRSSASRISEADVCEELGIALRFGVGGEEKADSSTRIIAAMSGPEYDLRTPLAVLEHDEAGVADDEVVVDVGGDGEYEFGSGVGECLS